MEAHGSFQFLKVMALMGVPGIKGSRYRRARPRVSRAKRRKVAKPVKSYVKRMIAANAEKKEFAYQSIGTNWDFADITSWNLNYHGVTRGTGETQFVGNGYKIKLIQVNFQLSNYSRQITNMVNTPISFMCMIVKTKVFKTLTSLDLVELFDENYTFGSTPASYFRDSDKCKILAQKRVTLMPDPDGTRKYISSKIVKLFVRPNITFKYRDFDSSYEGQTGNYYALVIPTIYPQGPPGAVGVDGNVYTRLTFTDS